MINEVLMEGSRSKDIFPGAEATSVSPEAGVCGRGRRSEKIGEKEQEDIWTARRRNYEGTNW